MENQFLEAFTLTLLLEKAGAWVLSSYCKGEQTIDVYTNKESDTFHLSDKDGEEVNNRTAIEGLRNLLYRVRMYPAYQLSA